RRHHPAGRRLPGGAVAAGAERHGVLRHPDDAALPRDARHGGGAASLAARHRPRRSYPTVRAAVAGGLQRRGERTMVLGFALTSLDQVVLSALLPLAEF